MSDVHFADGSIPNCYTFFFREVQSLRMIRDRVIQQRANRGESTSILSVGCANGAETYSLAMIASSLLHGVEIVGADINPALIEAAAAGSYVQRQLRRLPADERRRWFRPQGDREIISERLRDAVRFEPFDMTADVAPRSRMSSSAPLWDVILCRHVLIHLSPKTIPEAIGRLVDSLAPEGILVLSASEWLSIALRCRGVYVLQLVDMEGVFAYVKKRAPEGELQFDLPPIPRRETPTWPASPLPKAATPGPSTNNDPLSASTGDLRIRGDEALDAGETDDALTAYNEAIERSPTTADLHLRIALCYLRRNRGTEAIEACRRSLFLDQNMWPAALILADLVADSEPKTSKRYLHQARSALLDHESIEDAEVILAPFIINRVAALESIRRRLESTELPGRRRTP